MRDSEDPTTRQLKAEYPGWYFWRARQESDGPAEGDNPLPATGSWMATRTDYAARRKPDPLNGISPTLIAATALDLRKQLAEERDPARRTDPAS